MVFRGAATVNRIKEQAKKRQAGRFSRQINIEKDVPTILRFRGLTVDAAGELTVPRSLIYTEKSLRKKNLEKLTDIQLALQGRYHEEMKADDLVAAILERYTQREPAVTARHYAERNKGKKGVPQYLNCGDPDAALQGDFRKETKCRVCHAIAEGDKGIGYPQPTLYFSTWDSRHSHMIKKGEDKEYEQCTLDTIGTCKHCSWNRKLAAREGFPLDWEKIKKEQRDAVIARGYRPRYLAGMTYGGWALRYADGILACERRVRQRCRSCGTGKLKPQGAACPLDDCGEEFDWDGLIAGGWDPTNPSLVTCPTCEQPVVPEMILECSKCDRPERAQLGDVDVTVERTGERQQTNWQFSENLPVRPLNPFESDDDARILRTPLPDFEAVCAEPSVSDQLRFLGLVEDPLGNGSSGVPILDLGGKAKGKRPAKAQPAGVKKKKRPKGSMFSRLA